MHRVLIILTAIVLVVGSLAVGTLTADLPFWRRAFDLPLASSENYFPTLDVGRPATGAVTAVDPARNSVEPAALAAAADSARAAGAAALLVARRGELQYEEYFQGGDGWRALRPADFLARPLAALAVGMTLADGRVKSLDDRLAKYLPEWQGDPRGRITLRQLLNETSGLAQGADAARVLGSHPFADWSRLPDFATARGVRLLLGNDFESTALAFELHHEPGGFFNLSAVNTQLAAVIVERAAGLPYERFLERRLLAPAHLFHIQLQMDRRSGMPAAHCCLRAVARDVLAIGELLRNDGAAAQGGRVLPVGWVKEMLKGSRANPEFGLQLERMNGAQLEIWHLGGELGGAVWIVPSRDLTVVALADRDVRLGDALLAPLLGALRK
ncbi:MAG: serine hydrolase domain-containing protein [Pseudomonadota bacterium]